MDRTLGWRHLLAVAILNAYWQHVMGGLLTGQRWSAEERGKVAGQEAEGPVGAFVVMQPRRIRITHLPEV